MQIRAESGKSALPICNYSQILYQFLTFTQNLKRSQLNTTFQISSALSHLLKSRFLEFVHHGSSSLIFLPPRSCYVFATNSPPSHFAIFLRYGIRCLFFFFHLPLQQPALNIQNIFLSLVLAAFYAKFYHKNPKDFLNVHLQTNA